ncbi:MAG: hypothetical protein R3D67_20250 [Hyphomicrobiaceae bacterium]
MGAARRSRLGSVLHPRAAIEIRSIPEILASRERDAPEMARRARAAWEEWFAADVVFHRLVESCLAIKRQRRLSVRLQSKLNYLWLLEPHYFRHWLLADMKRLVAGEQRAFGAEAAAIWRARST